MDDLNHIARFAARAAAALSNKSTPKNDPEAFAAAYAILRDYAAASAVADELLTEWTARHTVPTLPDLDGDVVVVNGERLRRQRPFYFHGDHVFVEDEQQWYMACEDHGSVRATWWNRQSPFEANQHWFRREAAKVIDEVSEQVSR